MKKFTLTNQQIGSLCGAFAQLLHAGISTGDALTLLHQSESHQQLRSILQSAAAQADRGVPLAQILRQADCFPAYVCALVDAGERVGKTEQTLAALADYYDTRDRMERRLRSTLTYPAILLGVLLAVMVILLVWVLPLFNEVYAQLGSRLTGLAGGLLQLGIILRQILPAVCVLLALGLVCAILGPVRRKLLGLYYTHWGDRGVFAQVNSARFVQILCLGISSGMAHREAAEFAAELAGGENRNFSGRCSQLAKTLDAGDSLPQALLKTNFLDAGDARLLDTGIRSGQADQVLESVSQRLLEHSQEALEQQTGRIEPAMVAISCVLIGAVLLSVMLPLMHIMNAIG